MPISLVAASAMAYWGRFNLANPETLPIGPAFKAANGRDWLVKFWNLDGKWVGIALPFGVILWILFFFDHNVSVSPLIDGLFSCICELYQSLMAQGTEFPLRKPPGFHWDFFLLGITTFIAGLIGVPAPNGLIPQAPIHTTSLVIMGHDPKDEESQNSEPKSEPPPRTVSRSSTGSDSGSNHDLTLRNVRRGGPRNDRRRGPSHLNKVPVGVVEQRVSNLAQGSLCLVLLTGPLLHVLNLISRGVLAGLLYVDHIHQLFLIWPADVILSYQLVHGP